MIRLKILKAILEAGGSFSRQPREIDSAIIDIFQSVSLQHYTKNQTEKIIHELNNGRLLSDVLTEYNFTLTYLPELLQDIVSIKTKNNETIEFLSYSIFYSYIAFLSQFEITKVLPNVILLLKSLIFAFNSSQKILAGECFAHIFELFLEYDNKNHSIYSITEYFLIYANIFPCPKLTLKIFDFLYQDELFETDPNFYNFLDQLAEVVQYHKNFFDSDSLLTLIEPLSPIILQFQPSAVKLFMSIHSYSKEVANLIFPNISQIILPEIFKCNLIELNLPKTEPIHVSIPSIININYAFSKKETFLCDFNPSQIKTFPKQLDFSSILSLELTKKLKQIVLWTKYEYENIKMVLNSLFELLHLQEESEFFFNVLATISFFSNEIFVNSPQIFKSTTELALEYFHKNLFNPSFTIFDEIQPQINAEKNKIYNNQTDNKTDINQINNDNSAIEKKYRYSEDVFQLLNTFRSISFDYICSDDGNAINEILNNRIISYPLLLAEFLYRLVNDLSLLVQKVETCPALIDTFRKIALVYQTLDLSIEDPKLKDGILKARVALFTLFAHLFAQNSVIEIFFTYSPYNNYLSSEKSFASAYLSFLFEDRIRPYIISSIRNYFLYCSNIKISNVGDLASIFYCILKNVELQLPGSRPMQMIHDFLEMMNEILLYKHNFLESFKSLCPVICKSLTKLSTDELSKKIFEISISFFAMMSEYFEIKNLEIDALLYALISFNDLEFVESLYTKLIQLLAGEKLPSITPHFIVRQPQIIKIFVHFLFSTPRLHDLLVFIYELLQFSPLNLQACANCDLDIFILEFLEKTKSSETLNEESLKLVLSIYSLLSTRHSTAQSVLRYISLLAPIDDTHVTKYEPIFFTTLENIISSLYKTPEYTFPLNGTKAAIPILVDEEITYGFSIAFWIRAENNECSSSPDFRGKLFQITFNDKVTITLTLSGTTLLFSQDDFVTDSVAKLTDNFPLHTWNFIVLSYRLQSLRNMIVLYINCHEDSVSTIQALKPPLTAPHDTTNVSLVVGGGSKDTSQLPTLLGPFGIFPVLSDDEQIIIREMGVRPNIKPSIPHYVFIIKENGFTNSDSSNFVDVLISKCGIDTILPIFKLRNYKFTDGTLFDFQFEYGILLLTKLLIFSYSAQTNFCECKGFNIICQIIIDYWLDTFNSKFYHIFTSLMQTIISEKLQIQLFIGLLTHFTFLMKIDSHTHSKILKYWAQSLFSSFRPIAIDYCGPNVILAALRRFYYYNTNEASLIFPNDLRPDNLNVQLCRSFLFDILYYFYSIKFDKDDFTSLISHCVSCTEFEQSIEMFNFFIKILGEFHESITFNIEDSSFTFLIHFFIRYPYDKLQYLTIDLLNSCYSFNLISKDYYSSQILSLIKILPKHAKTIKMLHYIQDKFKENPSLLPLLCYFVILFKEEELDNLINSLKPSIEYTKFKFWAIWPLILTLHCNAQQAGKVILFLIECDPNNILDLYAQFDIVFSCYKTEQKIIENFFVVTLAHIYVITNTPPPVEDYLELSKHILFFRHDNEETTLSSMYLKSEFFDPNQNKNNRIQESESDFTMKTFIMENVFDSIIDSVLFKFGVRYTPSSRCWSHINLALSCIEKFSESNHLSEEYSIFDLILCSFLQDVDYYGVYEHLKKVKIPETDFNIDIIHLLHYHTKMAEQPQYYRSDRIVLNLNSPLTNEAKFTTFISELEPHRYNHLLNQKVHIYSDFHSKVIELDDFITKVDINMIAANSINEISKLNNRELSSSESRKDRWARLWNALTIERAPWHLKNKTNNIIWKRDMSLCSALTPLKMIRMQQLDLIENTINEKSDCYEILLDCVKVTPNKKEKVRFAATKTWVYLSSNSVQIIAFPISAIKYFFWHQQNGIFIITELGFSLVLDFFSIEDHKKAIYFFSNQTKSKCELFQNLPSKQFFYQTPFQRRWRKWKISNYYYIVLLNFLSGRNFNDIDNYPIMPWVIHDYSGEQLILKRSDDHEIFRDFSLSINDKAIKENKLTIENMSQMENKSQNNSNSGSECLKENKQAEIDRINEQNGSVIHISQKEKKNDIYLSRNDVIMYLKNIPPFNMMECDNCESLNIYGMEDFLQHSLSLTNKSLELIPEFYSMPEIFENQNFALPLWANSSIDFVYQHRKALESSYVSANIHEWITQMWSSSKGSNNPLFDGEHPLRPIRAKQALLDDIFDFDMGNINQLMSAKLVEKGRNIITLFVLLENGIVFSYKFSSAKRRKTYSLASKSIPNTHNQNNNNHNNINMSNSVNQLSHDTGNNLLQVNNDDQNEENNLNNNGSNNDLSHHLPPATDPKLIQKHHIGPEVSYKTEPILTSPPTKYSFPSVSFEKVHALPDGNFLVIDKKTKKVTLIGSRPIFLDAPLHQITCLTADGSWIVVGGDSSVYLYNSYKLFCSIQLYRDLILTAAVSSSFNVVVGGTNDGFLIICSIIYGSMVKVIDLKKMIPKKVIISPSWGFIVSYCEAIVLGAMKHYILVHSINGEPIRKTEIQFEVKDWICWSDRGFDHMLILSNDETVYHCEVYYMNISRIFKEPKSKTVGLSYSTKASCAIITKASGHAFFIPYVIK
ncbi:hypothetical protein TRFO_35436 [Tritrichomonas foetus]|uniref:BEACH domain-containing protein n=1 Tax=Tritrichomonas foetus TaxID=1144522 RepID=A0A1J4JKU2_9EUKA|nr:hypothetical protein TRFO_35436 [Tritrichomonas foetus]|eukprot:OHS98203.1 hypothetical protein TRFO_35436 [Tritrichomonas foetus]